jgi:hypothetical protein
MFRPYGFAVLAEALTRQGEHAPSLAAVREGMEEQAETGALRWKSELQRLGNPAGYVGLETERCRPDLGSRRARGRQDGIAPPCGGGLRPALTAFCARRGAVRQVGTEKRPVVELRNIGCRDGTKRALYDAVA